MGVRGGDRGAQVSVPEDREAYFARMAARAMAQIAAELPPAKLDELLSFARALVRGVR